MSCVSSSLSPAAVSSSSTLWATASKEWVIPAKPKPGRKPKAESAPVVEETHVDGKGRRVQNRAAQRAFRERKQSQLADLQARVQLFEQGEIERNVALQAVAKKLKEENENLKKENQQLKEELEKMRSRPLSDDKKRVRDEGSEIPLIVPDNPARKRPKTIDPPTPTMFSGSTSAPHSALTFAASPSPLASSPESTDSLNSSVHPGFSPFSYQPANQYMTPMSGFQRQQVAKATNFDSNPALDSIVPCGLCTDNTPCVCRDLVMQRAAAGIAGQEQNLPPSSRPDAADQLRELFSASNNTSSVLGASDTAGRSAAPSILDNLPAFQPPVPLRRLNARTTPARPVFYVSPPADSAPQCSGDPSNCAACADDPFGKAFCAALGDAVCSNNPCPTCPNAANGSGSPCSAAVSAAHSRSPTPINSDGTLALSPAPGQGAPATSSSETIPRAEAWRQLKAHPNVGFADLRLLAEVVARRSACQGPRVTLSPSPTPAAQSQLDAKLSKHIPKAENDAGGGDQQSIILTDPHARYRERQAAAAYADGGGALSLVPQDVLLRCGRARLLEVQADGVRDALRLLDVRFTPSS
ncbi:hypothetical protein SISNIDRAFT_483303 [Sistotremastrum niveocremeum HHB9708]|uniref:BZIP domain-containing protein n=1 Tax=Sistotremastrum niveocremeum HHB9708 TaxID=1314777 RepID=A0A164XE20_9AGAM|nr:hypothetical protein SISNIDRAFT_483303 [Sistotremastrum niveocremeum HHB9708]